MGDGWGALASGGECRGLGPGEPGQEQRRDRGECSPLPSRPHATWVAPAPGCLVVECRKMMGNPKQRQ